MPKDVVGYILMGIGLFFLILGEKLFNFFAGVLIGITGGLFVYTTLSNFVPMNFIGKLLAK
jgi:hypothetical protein